MGQYHNPAETIRIVGRKLQPHLYGDTTPDFAYMTSQLQPDEVLAGLFQHPGNSGSAYQPFFTAPLLDSFAEFQEFATNTQFLSGEYFAVPKTQFGTYTAPQREELNMFEPLPEGVKKRIFPMTDKEGNTVITVQESPNLTNDDELHEAEVSMVASIHLEYMNYIKKHHITPQVHSIQITVPEHLKNEVMRDLASICKVGIARTKDTHVTTFGLLVGFEIDFIDLKATWIGKVGENPTGDMDTLGFYVKRVL